MAKLLVAARDVRARSWRQPNPPDFSVLFVCHGNICRSSMAHGVLRAMLAEQELLDRTLVDSAGVSDYNIGRRPFWRARRCLQRHGISIGDLRARQVKQMDFARFDLILPMDDAVLANLRSQATNSDAVERIRPFSDGGIDDPVTGDDATFEAVYATITARCERLVEEIAQRIAGR